MVPTFLVVLREAFEAALLLGIVYTYLQKTGRTDHYAYATWGAVTGVLASIALGVGISVVSGPEKQQSATTVFQIRSPSPRTTACAPPSSWASSG